ncbi:Protein transport protein SFT2 [Rhodotorula toruloides]|uniref:Protein transport protein SFT2 n=1 Tax=Rhodotorula toruloides TaxID=5286 RepID=A0A0K3CD33_RHOTO|nr:Protein transport protein SFT2 [Rhodotorula toruloides]PRQ75556.1 SFT2-domain-containing protein [Rhodotorula toruloides]
MSDLWSKWNPLSGSEAAGIVDNMTTQDESAFKFLDLTRTQRLYGFGICVAVGFALSLLGAIFFALGQVALFATLYVVGVVASLVGTGFLLGFMKQLRMMWDPVRRYAAAIFLLCIALTFVFAFVISIDVLVIVFAVCTYLAYAWYSLSYIPYARTLAKKMWPF